MQLYSFLHRRQREKYYKMLSFFPRVAGNISLLEEITSQFDPSREREREREQFTLQQKVHFAFPAQGGNLYISITV